MPPEVTVLLVDVEEVAGVVFGVGLSPPPNNFVNVFVIPSIVLLTMLPSDSCLGAGGGVITVPMESGLV